MAAAAPAAELELELGDRERGRNRYSRSAAAMGEEAALHLAQQPLSPTDHDLQMAHASRVERRISSSPTSGEERARSPTSPASGHVFMAHASRRTDEARTPRAHSPEHEYDKLCRFSPRRERIKREREKAQRVEDAKSLSARLLRARTPPRAGRASLEVRHMVRTNGMPGAAGHPDTKPEMDLRQRARMNKILGTMSAFSQLAIEEAEAVLAEANAEREWDDVKQAQADLAEARQSGDERLIAKMIATVLPCLAAVLPRW